MDQSIINEQCKDHNSKVIKSPLDLASCNGNTALLLIATEANLHIIKKLIENGADINVKDTNGRNALHLLAFTKDTVSNGNIFECCKFLVDNGIDVNLQDINGDTPLIRFIDKSRKINCDQVMMYLIDQSNKS